MIAPENDHDWLAAEYALGLLDGAELAAAREVLRRDPAFAREVAIWTGRFIRLTDEASPADPPADGWSRVAASLPDWRAANDNGAQLQRRLRFWRGWSIGATALAASLGLLLLVDQRTPPIAEPPTQQATDEPMLATMAAEGSAARLVAVWEPASRGLTVAAAAGVVPVAGHSHELWIIPGGGDPQSLGVMPQSGRMHARLPVAQAGALGEGATLAISIEPAGGSPSGRPTGPVIAAGQLLPT